MALQCLAVQLSVGIQGALSHQLQPIPVRVCWLLQGQQCGAQQGFCRAGLPSPFLPSPPLLPSSQGAHLSFFLNQGWAPAMDETQIPPGHGPSSEVYLGMHILTFSPSCPGGPGSPISPCSQNNLRSLSEQRRIVALPLCRESSEGMYLHCLHFAGEDSDEDSELCAQGP